jgi:RNA polymerase sigma-70 factor (ECF subfamily)
MTASEIVVNFREVYDEHAAFVWRALRRLGVPDAHVRDAMQDVFLVMHRRLPEFDGRAKVTTWLFRVCFNTARDYRRRAHVRYEVVDTETVEQQADADGAALENLERRERQALVERALARLTLEQRAVFVLFELEDQTGEQIAETLMIPLGTVYSRLRLARAEFRKGIARETAKGSRSANAAGMP